MRPAFIKSLHSARTNISNRCLASTVIMHHGESLACRNSLFKSTHTQHPREQEDCMLPFSRSLVVQVNAINSHLGRSHCSAGRERSPRRKTYWLCQTGVFNTTKHQFSCTSEHRYPAQACCTALICASAFQSRLCSHYRLQI